MLERNYSIGLDKPWIVRWNICDVNKRVKRCMSQVTFVLFFLPKYNLESKMRKLQRTECLADVPEGMSPWYHYAPPRSQLLLSVPKYRFAYILQPRELRFTTYYNIKSCKSIHTRFLTGGRQTTRSTSLEGSDNPVAFEPKILARDLGQRTWRDRVTRLIAQLIYGFLYKFSAATYGPEI